MESATPARPPARSRAFRRRIGALSVCTLAVGSALLGGMASADATSNVSTGPLDILLGVGTNQSQRIVSWYFPSNAPQTLQIEKNSDLTGGDFNATATVIDATEAANGAADSSTSDSDTKNLPGIAAQSGYTNAHATVTDLLPNTAYSYHVGAADGSNWSKTYTFTTPSDSNDFTFDFFGDPQIGSSGHVDDDALGWAATLAYATDAQTTKPELLVSGGDQIEHANNEYEWSAFADGSDVLKQYPWAATIGNHDVGGKAYEQHNSTPNVLKNADFYPGGATSTTSGGDYWFIYKDVLFIDINSNAYSGGADAEHVNYVRDVIGQHGDQAKWTALVYHHSIYSPADHANDTDNQQRRFDFTRAFSDLGVDLVLQGHDHSYSRSYALLNSGKTAKKANPAEAPDQSEIFPGPGGVIYVTANSSSGSKYYDLTTPTGAGGYGADTQFPATNNYGQPRHWSNSVENQEHVRTFIKVSVTDNKLDVTNVRSGDCAAPNSAVINGTVAQPFCGKLTNTYTPGTNLPSDDAASLGGPIGSAVDQFNLNRFLAPSAVTISGARQVGQTLTAHLTRAFSAGTEVTYAWKADGVAFGPSTASVQLTPAQLGKTITATATGTLLNYEPKSVTSAPTGAIAAAPLTVARATITGTAKVGLILTAHPGAVRSGSTAISGATVKYQWYISSAKSGGLTSAPTYKIPAAAKGKRVTVIETVSKTGYRTAVSPAASPTRAVAT